MSETCGNCGQTIGKLETPHLWDGTVVCAQCVAKLGPAPVRQKPGGHDCPHCGASDTARMDVAYARENKIGTWGGVGVAGDDVAFVGGKSHTVSAFGETLAPPDLAAVGRKRLAIGIALLIASAACLLFYATASEPQNRGQASAQTNAVTVGLVTLVVGGILAAWGIIRVRDNAGLERARSIIQTKWRESWVCYRCGGRWTPTSKK